MTKLFSQKILLEKPLEWHDAFNRERWQNQDSFHNRSHIEATEEASKAYLEYMTEEKDPLGAESGRQKWNGAYPEAEIRKEELAEAITWAIRVHDLGNILKTVTAAGGGLQPVFLDRYTAEGSEGRSQEIAETLLRNSDLSQDKRRRFIPFVRHLIGETKFQMGDPYSPFATYMRVMDQIGNDFYSLDGRRVWGLLEEMAEEESNALFNPYFFFNFARERLPRMIPDEKDRKVLLEEIWRKGLPKEITQYKQEQIRVADFLATSKNF